MRIDSLLFAVALAVPFSLVDRTAICSEKLGPDLLKRAGHVADVDDWFGRRFHLGIGIQWANDRTVIHTRSSGPNDEKRVAYRLDVRTGHETRLAHLTKALYDFEGEVVDSQEISPDGKWFVRSARWADCLVAEVDGSRHYTVKSRDPDDCYREVYWLADSRHWLERFSVNRRTHLLFLHDVLRPADVRQLKVGKQSVLYCSLARVLTLQNAIAIVEPGHGMSREADRHRVEVYRLSLDDKQSVKRSATIHIPRGTDYHCLVSPQGDRVAFPLTIQSPSGPAHVEIWVCDILGRKMRRLGWMTMETGEGAYDLRLHWLPGGQRLGFLRSRCLYTISASGG